MDTKQKKRILIVDDDREIARLVRRHLEQAGYTVLVAHNGETAERALRREAFDLLILDLGLPDMAGWDLTRMIRADARLKSLPIVMLTARLDDSNRMIGLALGADDYIPKPLNAREVVARVHALLRRVQMGTPVRGKILRVNELALDVERRELTVADRPVELTPTEYQLMLTFMNHPNTIFDRDELLEQALGYAYEGMSRTLDNHIKNLRQKIEEDPKQPSLIQTVHRMGYRLVGERR